jgi:hypothetical protein
LKWKKAPQPRHLDLAWIKGGYVNLNYEVGGGLMRKYFTLLIVCLFFMAIGGLAGAQGSPHDKLVVGVNVVGVDQLTEQQQATLIEQLRHEGVKTIRTGMSNDKYVAFIIRAYQAGIGTIAIVYPEKGGTGKHTSAVDPSIRRLWGVAAYSDNDPNGFRTWFTPRLAAVEAAGVHLACVELGNEFNTARFNGDFPDPGTKRVLGISDLNNQRDSEGQAVANGFRSYLKIMAVMREMLNHSRLNAKTTLISGGLAPEGLPGPLMYGGAGDAVSLPDTIEFLRQNGMDKLVDGYGVHFYPNNNPHQSTPERAQVIEKNGIFAACKVGDKPCWLTEWAFNNTDKSCPIDDTGRLHLVQSERTVFQTYVAQNRLGAVIYYSWSGGPKDSENQGAIFRCGALTDAGKLALNPF